MKKSLTLLIGIFFIAAACTGGSSGTAGGTITLPGGGQASYTANITPEDISGCYKITGTVTKNTCDISMSDTSTAVTICLTQDDADVVITASSSSSGGGDSGTLTVPAPSDGDTDTDADVSTASVKAGGGSSSGDSDTPEVGTPTASTESDMEDVFDGSNLAGEVSGNQFLVEVSATQTYDECTVTLAAAYVGTVTGDAIAGTNQGAITATGDCSSLGVGTDCVTAVDYSGSRTSSSSGGGSSGSSVPSETANAESNIPAGSSIDSGATIPIKSIAKKSSGWFIIRK